MKYDFKHTDQQHKAHQYLLKLIERESKAELKNIPDKRSISQNAYFHVLINLFAIEYGDTANYVKQTLLKEIVCLEIFKTTHTNRKTGEIRGDWRSSADLDSKEMTQVIDKFRTWSSMTAGIYLPSAEEHKTDWITYLQQIENNSEYL